MRWRKLGRMFVPDGSVDWMTSHAMVPFAEHLEDDRFRVYFSSRDRSGRGHVGRFDIDMKDPTRVLSVSPRPLLGPGPLGAFDDNGVTLTWITQLPTRRLLYYNGWSLGVSVPFYLSIGQAISEDGGVTYRRISAAPLFERSTVDPFLTASASVLVEDGHWRMWYVSAERWEATQAGPKHFYHIRYADSIDGLAWRREGRVCLDFSGPDEHAIARPCVLRDGQVYRMWYCHRGPSYRIGYAESNDGLAWERLDDEVGIDVSPNDWDGEMLAYPHVFDHEGRRYMLYNGNDYGRTGIGLAVLESD